MHRNNVPVATIGDTLNLAASEMAALIRRREITSVELMTAHIRRIEEVNPTLNAVVQPLFDSAMDSARAADQALAKKEDVGPLHGVPFSVKDSIDVTGARTTAGTLGRRNADPAQNDATLVGRLRRGGAIPLAKTNLPDLLFAYESDNLIFGRTNNPYDLDRTPGGSSGGESALIAAGGSPFGLGSDAAGSVRIPAAFCGIASLKPTSGCLPRTGHVPPASGWVEALWQIGPMARRASDLSVMLPLLAGPDGSDFTTPPAHLAPTRAKDLRIAFLTYNGFATPMPAMAEAVCAAAALLEREGATVEEEKPAGLDSVYDLELDLLGADGCDGIDEYLRHLGAHPRHSLLEDGFLKRMHSRRASASQFASRWNAWDSFRRSLAEFFERYDALLCPVYTQPALRHGESVQEENFRGFSYAMAWNVGGLPAATVRCASHNGLPVNVQIVTARWNDRLALAFAERLEEGLGGWAPPPLLGGDEHK